MNQLLCNVNKIIFKWEEINYIRNKAGRLLVWVKKPEK